MKNIFIVILIFTSILSAQNKHLILAEGNSWFPHMAENLIENHEKISKLPFSGFVVVGNSYTSLVMKKNKQISYEHMWNELKGLKGLYKNKNHNFLQVNIDFPGDFWDDKKWEQVTKNFETVAKVAKDLGFKGIVFDDEPYNLGAKKMVNFKFPSKKEIKLKPNKYKSWQKKGAEPAWVDEYAYRNKLYTFSQHMTQVTLRFKAIMTAMSNNNPDLVTLVYLGPSLSHMNSNKNYPIVINMGLPRENEYHGAIFTGLKQGLSPMAQLHDMGESYKYRKNKHFGYAYQWRKHDIANDKYNDTLDAEQHWVLPKSERDDWSKKVEVGFMVFNKGQESNYAEYNTLENSTLKDIKATLQKALKFSDKYVIYYCQEEEWLLPKRNPPSAEWIKMMTHIYTHNTK